MNRLAGWRRIGAACALGLTMTLAQAQGIAIRVANQGDVLSLDPHSLNEAVQLAFLNNVFESLVTRDRALLLVPSLATQWRAVSPTLWRFDLRAGVQFHDGTAFSADDVVFSLDRARGEGSDVRGQLGSVRAVRKTGPLQVEIETSTPNPILPDVMSNILILSKTWCEAHDARRPVDRRRGIENAASFRANGTGPYRVRERQPGVRTVLDRHGPWWGRNEGNVDRVEFLPLANDATRVAALLSGEVDVVDPLPLGDVARVRATPGLSVLDSPELRVIFLGFDQLRDELLHSNVKGRNPFKDRRVRQAVYQAIDVESIRRNILRGAATPTGSMIPTGTRGHRPDMNLRRPHDPDAAKRLLAEAGYPSGFEVGMQCPNDRYVSDIEVCQAVAGQLARVGIQVRLSGESKTTYFPRALRREVSLFLLGWSPAGYDAHSMLFTVLGSPAGARGQWNFGAYSNPQLDGLAARAQSELDDNQRNELIRQALALHEADVGHVPLYEPRLSWGLRSDITTFQRADGFMLFKWMQVRATDPRASVLGRRP